MRTIVAITAVACLAAFGLGQATQSSQPASEPAAVDPAALATQLRGIADPLRDISMNDAATTLETVAGHLAGRDQLTTDDVRAVRKLADQLNSLAVSYSSVRPDRTTLLKTDSKRLHEVADQLDRLASATPATPGAPMPAKAGAEIGIGISYIMVTPKPIAPPATPNPGGTPRPAMPPPQPIRQLSIRVADATENFNNPQLLLAHLSTKYGDRLDGAVVKVTSAPDVLFQDLQALVTALASNKKLAAVRVENLPVRYAADPAAPTPGTPTTEPTAPPAAVPGTPTTPAATPPTPTPSTPPPPPAQVDEPPRPRITLPTMPAFRVPLDGMIY